MSNLLVIDDDHATSDILVRIVRKLGHTCKTLPNLTQGVECALDGDFDIVILDVCLPDGNGLEYLSRIKEAPSSPEVIIVTAFGDPDGAELAITGGAWDYLIKPSSVDHIMLTIKRALDYRKEKKAAAVPKLLKREEIIGNSPKLNACLERVAQASASSANTLIIGETGTGKELFARAIHNNSSQNGNRFIVVDCAALPESLVESTLFGHEKGAYTGADKERDGLIKQSDGGTLFLDEIGELPLSIQKTFLRVIQERKFRPVSGKKEVSAKFRLIAATNRNLSEMAKKGHFREDLLFRLRSISIHTPPLRDRKEDIKRLTQHYVNRLCEIYAAETKGFSPDFFESLALYNWPGNVRELFNTLEEVLSVARDEPTLFAFHLPTHIRAAIAKISVKATAGDHKEPDDKKMFDEMTQESILSIAHFKNEMERKYLEKLTQLTDGNRKEACRISGLSRTRLFELLKKHNISKTLRKKTAHR